MDGRGGQEVQVFWKECKEGSTGVGILVAEKWVENVIEVKKLSERIMLLRISIGMNILNVISGYAPQMGRAIVDKEEFWLTLGKVVDGIGQEELVVIGGDMNGRDRE